jgi:hypothetical protein
MRELVAEAHRQRKTVVLEVGDVRFGKNIENRAFIAFAEFRQSLVMAVVVVHL